MTNISTIIVARLPQTDMLSLARPLLELGDLMF